MTSFERFKRDMRSKSSSQIKSSIRKVNEKNDQRVHDFVSFSASQIIFKYDSQSTYSAFKLNITNLTGYKIHFKIRCNNSKCYTVTPFQEVVADGKSIQVKFQFLPHLYDVNHNTNDKFQIMWGKIPYQPNQAACLTESKIFPVYVREKDPNDDYFKDFSPQKQVAIKTNNFYRESQPSIPLDLKQQKIASSILQSNMPYQTLLTKTNLILVSAVAFVLGFIFS